MSVRLRVRVKVLEDRTDEEAAKLRKALADGIAAGVPYVVRDAERRAPRQTGGLRDSIVARQVGPLTWLVVAQAPHAHIIEGGSVRLPARPFLLPALLAQRGTIAKKIHEAANA